MGILERLGLRGRDDKAFSTWLGEQIPQVTDGDEVMLELDRRVAAFVDQQGEVALIQALDDWIDRTDRSVLRGIPLLQNEQGWATQVAGLRQRHGVEGRGLALLESTLDRLGALETRLIVREDGPIDGRDPIPALIDLIRPLTRADQDLRLRLNQLARMNTIAAAWELYAVRSSAVFVATSRVLSHDEARVQSVMGGVLAKLASMSGDPAAPSDPADFLDQRWLAYATSVNERQVAGKSISPVGPHAIGRLFARYCGSESIEVRSIGTRGFADAVYRGEALVKAYKAHE